MSRPSHRRHAFTLGALALLGAVALVPPGRARGDEAETKKALAQIAELEWARDLSVKAFLGDAEVSVRRAAARALGRIAAPGDEIAAAESETVQMLLAARLREEKEPAVRRELLQGLGFAGTPRAARELVKVRDGGDAAEALIAARALRLAAQESDRADLVRGLALDAPLRDESALALGVLERRLRSEKIATIDTATRSALLEKLARKTSYELVYALAALGDPRPDARAALAKVLATSKDPETRAEAVRGLTRSAKADTPVPPELLADYDEPFVATEVVHALAKHAAQKAARERLVALLAKHRSFHVRRDAAAALGAKPAAGVPADEAAEVAALEKALADPYATVRANALVALAERAPAKGYARAKALVAKGPADRMAAARALAMLVEHFEEQEHAIKLVVELGRSDPDHRVRMTAVSAFFEHGTDDFVVALATHCVLMDDDPGVFEAGTEALLEKGGTEGESRLLEGYERVRAKHDFVEAREMIVEKLAERGAKLTEAGKRLLELAATDPEPAVVAALARAKGGKKAARPPRKKPPVEVADWSEKRPSLLVKTSRGAFKVELLPAVAPLHVANIVALAERKFYDGLTWHRVVSNFVIQGGCPRGDGSGDAGYTIPDELSLEEFTRGTLGMPKSATKDTGGCQVFFMHSRAPHLEGRYTVFGRIVEGAEVVDLIEEGDTIDAVEVLVTQKIR